MLMGGGPPRLESRAPEGTGGALFPTRARSRSPDGTLRLSPEDEAALALGKMLLSGKNEPTAATVSKHTDSHFFLDTFLGPDNRWRGTLCKLLPRLLHPRIHPHPL